MNKEEVLSNYRGVLKEKYKFFEYYELEKEKHKDDEQIRLMEFAFDNPTSNTHFVFHGGCLGCKSPENFGLIRCLGCMYFNFGVNEKDLSYEN